jgi:flagellar biosynthesis protein FlhG
MHDQANDLRRLVRQAISSGNEASANRPKLIVVSGGKGGVGTTTVAVNLAVALVRRGSRTVLVDADTHGSDTRILCRLDELYTVADVLSSRRTVRESLQPGPGGIQVLPGAWAEGDISECSPQAQERLVSQLLDLGNRADSVVVDAGDGSNRLIKRLWQAADLVLLVTTSELASVMDAYASIKVLAAADDSIRIQPLVNMTAAPAEVDEVFGRLNRACLRFLGIHLNNADWLPADPQVVLAGKAEKPFVLSAAASPATLQIRRLAEATAQNMQLRGLGHPQATFVLRTGRELTVDGQVVQVLED